MNKEVEQIIEDHLTTLEDEWVRPSSRYFSQHSYSKWALEELLVEIRANEAVSPIVIVEQFSRKMDDYACAQMYTSYIFSVAHDVAEGILDELIA